MEMYLFSFYKKEDESLIHETRTISHKILGILEIITNKKFHSLKHFFQNWLKLINGQWSVRQYSKSL